MLPGTSGSSLRRMPPPPLSEYVNRWYSPPPGMGKLGLNFQPRAASHHAFVAAGSELASSVCVIQPYRPRVGICFFADRFGARRPFFAMTNLLLVNNPVGYSWLGRYVILRGHNLPNAAPFDPGVGEPVAAPKLTARSPAADDQPSGDHSGDGTEAMDDHRVVVCRQHGIRSHDDGIEHGRPVHRLIVLRVHEPVRQQPLEHDAVALHERARPVILQF